MSLRDLTRFRIGMVTRVGAHALGQSSTRHQACAVPALLKPALHQFTAGAKPAVLGHVLQVVEQFARPGFLVGMMNPDLWQALVRRELPRHAGQVLALHGGGDAFRRKRIGPQRGNGQIGGLGQAQHENRAYGASRRRTVRSALKWIDCRINLSAPDRRATPGRRAV